MKTFTSAAPTTAELALIDFEIQWWSTPSDGSDPVSGTEAFQARRYVPPGFALDLAGAVQLSEQGDRIYNVAAIGASMRASLTAESWERFNALLHDPDRRVQIEVLGELMMWLGEEITGRPTGQPST